MSRSKFEIRCQKELEDDGWLCDYKIRPSGKKNPPGYNVDYFGFFDIIAHKDNMVRWIAIKGQAGVPSDLREGIMDIQMGDSNVKEIWTYTQPTKNGKRVKNAPYRIRKEIIE